MNDERKYTILVVDDEENICEILEYNLKKNGYGADTAHSAEEALSLLRSKPYDLLLLDIMMGGMNGIELSQVLRQDYHNNIPIIFLSALDTEPDILRGFRSGGDDYIPKPFSINQVIARVGAVLNRCTLSRGQAPQNDVTAQTADAQATTPSDSKAPQASESITVGDLEIKLHEHKVFIGSNIVSLTKTEMGILAILAQNKGETVSREDILKKVWKGNTFVVQRTVDVHIARLRKKIEDSTAKIINRSGWGYSLEG